MKRVETNEGKSSDVAYCPRRDRDGSVDDDLGVPRPRLRKHAVPAPAYKVIRPDLIDFISYPYEWSYSQYKDAALLTLEVQRRAVERGMSLKDCSAYNVQFHEGRPILIDTLSLESYREGRPWVAYRQFCQHFL